MEQQFCQSCGMPLGDPGFYGTNEDESRNEDYCVFCFSFGKFNDDVTMEEMIEHCAEFLDEFNKKAPQKLTREEAVAQMAQHFPTLKRWRKQ